MKYKIGVGEKKFDVEVGEIQNGLAQVTVNQKSYQVTIEDYTEQMLTVSASKPAAAPKPAVTSKPAAASKSAAEPKPAPAVVLAPKAAMAAAPASADGNVIRAPIPGLVLGLKVQVGDTISAGQVVAILEAMKMENSITSSVSGIVKEIRVQKGTEVASGDVIMVIG